MTIRGGGNPHSAMAAMPLGEWTRRLGALPAEAYDCFMVCTPIRVQPNTSVVRAIDRGQWQAPLGSSRGPTIRLLAACRRARVRQGQAFGGAEEAPSLTAATRDGDANMRSGRKNACGAGRTKEWNDKGRQRREASLTTKAPYKPHTSRMPELGPYGSVRGARGNSRPYRERHVLRPSSSEFDRAAKLAAIPAGASPANRRRSSYCCSYIQQRRGRLIR